ncbi:uncharacterized protein LOC117116381 [Anneissia japonica]|uniref:uncharacterized protein LOC117116381 n=1 Tax=Anneissia japonica TaxID=1529436 RepID=UPI001425AB66|nr:uncharacterized protein LOC117116381 [Anneissia japonica]
MGCATSTSRCLHCHGSSAERRSSDPSEFTSLETSKISHIQSFRQKYGVNANKYAIDEEGHDNLGLGDLDEDDIFKKCGKKTPINDERENEVMSSGDSEQVNTDDYHPRNYPVLRKRPREIAPTKLTIEDLFWKGKRNIIPDLSALRRFDEHALKAPADLKNDVTALVMYLTRFAETELQKARVLFRWEANYLSYDVNYLDTKIRGDNSAEAALARGVCVCEGYAKLYKVLCEKAGLKCEYIGGGSRSAPGSDYEQCREDGEPIELPDSHAWNIVWIDDRPYQCDCTWASGGTDKDSSGKHKFEHKWVESMFIANPISFTSRHLPRDSNNQAYVLEEQMIECPFNNFDTWNATVCWGSLGLATGIQLLSHSTGVIESNDNLVEITIRNRHAMKYTGSLKEAVSEEKYKDRVIYFTKDDVTTFYVRLPFKGNFNLNISGNLINASPEVTETTDNELFSYKICGGPRSQKPFADSEIAGLCYGPSVEFLEAGFLPMLHIDGPFVKCVDGKVSIEVALVENGQLIANLTRIGKEDQLLDRYVYGEWLMDKIVYHIQCPAPGEYRFAVSFQSDTAVDDNQYLLGLQYLVTCEGKFARKEPYPPAGSGQYGPNKHFLKEKFELLGIPTSTIETVDGRGTLSIRFPSKHDITLTHSIKSTDDDEHNLSEKMVCAEIKTDCRTKSTEVNYKIVVPMKGNLLLQLFAGKSGTQSIPCIGQWLIQCDRQYLGDLYPSHKGIYGLTAHGKSSELEIVSPDVSTITSIDGTCCLTILCHRYSTTSFSYTLENNITSASMIRYVNGEVQLRGTTEGLIIFTFRLPKKGFYKFSIFLGSPGETTLPLAGCWLIDCHKKFEGEYYPEVPYICGPTNVFFEENFKLLKPRRGNVIANDGTCSLSVQVTKFKERNVFHKLEGDFSSHNPFSCVYADIDNANDNDNGDKVLMYHFRLPSQGYYKFTLYSGLFGQNSGKLLGCWLIESMEAWTRECFPIFQQISGPHGKFYEHGLEVVSPQRSTLTTSSGMCTLNLSTRDCRKLNMSCTLESDDKTRTQLRGCVSPQLSYIGNGNGEYTIKFRLMQVGVFKFTLFAGEDCMSVGCWLVECDEPCVERPFPNINGIVGPNKEFFDSGLEIVSPTIPHIIAADGTCQLVIRSKAFAEILCDLKLNGEGDSLTESITYNASTAGQIKTTTITFKLFSTGEYSCLLFVSQNANFTKIPFVGAWIVECKKPARGTLKSTARRLSRKARGSIRQAGTFRQRRGRRVVLGQTAAP